tara:strand:- start:677 stop:871 length:195 start_codon:yes stop_codon:yes gene_type:complete
MGLEVVCGGSMQVGDLVRYRTNNIELGNLGIIIGRDWISTAKVWIVEWCNGIRCKCPERSLEAV